MKKNKAIVLTIISALIYGFTPVLCSYTYTQGNNAFSMTFFRNFFVIPVLFYLMLRKKISFKISKEELCKIVFISFFGSVVTTLLLYSSYTFIGVGTTTTLHFLYPLFVVMLCHFVYRDKIEKKQMISLIIALIGILFFVDLKDFSKIQGIVMALLSGITFSIYLVGIEKTGLSTMNEYKLSFYIACTVCVCMLIFNVFTNQLIFIQSVNSYIAMFCVGLLASFIAVIFLKIGIQTLGSALASMFCLFEPISSIVFGYFLLNESITVFKVVGCLLIASAISLLVKRKN